MAYPLADNPIIDNKKSSKPTVVVPDIHARLAFVEKVFELYSPKEWDIVFTGDILHSETDGGKWRFLEKCFLSLPPVGQREYLTKYFSEELNASLDSLDMICAHLNEAPDSVFLLRGNHDDVSCKLAGDYGKHCNIIMESALFKAAFEVVYPVKYNEYLRYEKRIPYVYLGANFIASHTIPGEEVSVKKVKFNHEDTHWNFSWTDNTGRRCSGLDFVKENMNNLHGPDCLFWFIGHRPVYEGLVRTQVGGRLIQNNHPEKWVVLEVIGDNFIPKILD